MINHISKLLLRISGPSGLVRPRGRVAFANGCFDILHAGHLYLLMQARALADVLVVGINSDAGIRRLKGPDRPVFPQNERALLLAALDCVDHVVIFDTDTPAALIEQLRPDVMVKGEDWMGKEIVGKEYAGELVFVRFLTGYSTTEIINRIRSKNGQF